jgi:hypothetical protein
VGSYKWFGETCYFVLHPEDCIFYHIDDISAKLHGCMTQKALKTSHHYSLSLSLSLSLLTKRDYNELHS